MKLEPKEVRKFIADSEIEAMSKIEILSLTDVELVLRVDSVINQSVNAFGKYSKRLEWFVWQSMGGTT